MAQSARVPQLRQNRIAQPRFQIFAPAVELPRDHAHGTWAAVHEQRGAIGVRQLFARVDAAMQEAIVAGPLEHPLIERALISELKRTQHTIRREPYKQVEVVVLKP